MDNKLKYYIISVLRKASYKWGARNKVKSAARVERGKYSCNICKQIVGAKEIRMDHTDPVVSPVLGWQGFDIYIERMFIDEPGWQAICIPCDRDKQTVERQIRKENGHTNKRTSKKIKS